MPRLLQRQRLYRRLLIAALAVVLLLLAILVSRQARLSELKLKAEQADQQAADSQRAANLGNRAREQAEDLAAFMLDDLREQLVPLGRSEILGEAAARTLAYFENLPPELVTAATDQARASILATLASVHHDRGELDQACEKWRQSIELHKRLLESGPDSLELSLQISNGYNQLAIPLHEAGDRSGALTANKAALAIIDSLPPDEPEVIAARASTLFGLGECERHLENNEGALIYYAESIRTLGEPDSKDVGALQTLMTCHNNSGFCESEFGDNDAAEAAYLKALVPARRLIELEPDDRHWQKEIATLLNNLGTIHDERGDLEQAMPFHLEALALRESLVAWDPANTRWQLDLANSHRNVASVHLSGDAPDLALPPALKSLRIRQNLLIREPNNTEWLEELKQETRHLNERFAELGQPEMARSLTENIRAFAEKLDQPAVRSTSWNKFLSDIYYDLGNSPDALPADAIAAQLRATQLRAANTRDAPDDAETIYELAAAYIDHGEALIEIERRAAAIPCFQLARFLLTTRIAERFYRREALIDLCIRHETLLDESSSSEYRSLIPSGASWKYYDQRTPPPDDWATPGFDDSSWKSGPAELGYGDGDEATLISFGDDPDHKNLTSWYRHAFSLDKPPSAEPLRLSLLCDDGAVVYLNGTELLRHGMPEGPISPTTVANVTTSGLDEVIYRVFLLDPSTIPLREGRNTLAVEVHQNEGMSSDVTLAIELLADAPVSSPLDRFDPDLAAEVLNEAIPSVLNTWIENSAVSPSP